VPYCCRCGSPTGNTHRFCAVCGSPQLLDTAILNSDTGISPRTAATLCYVPLIGWVACVVALASAKFRRNRNVRFHAFQGIYLFVAWLLVDWGIGPASYARFWATANFPHYLLAGALKLVLITGWIFMLFKAHQDLPYKLPIVGDLAERSVAEQQN